MTRLWDKTWFRVTVIALLLLLQLVFLFTTLRLDTGSIGSEGAAWYGAALMQGQAGEVYDAAARPLSYEPEVNVFENAAALGVPPLYPLILRLVYPLLSGRSVHPVMIPRLLNLALFVLTWAALYLASRRLTGDWRSALLPPLAYGFSPAAMLALRAVGPFMLCTLMGAVTLAALLRIAARPRAALAYILLYLASLGGFLSLYAYAAFPVAAALIFILCMVFRHRPSPAVTVPVLIAGGFLTAVVLFPAAFDHLASAAVPFETGYVSRLKIYYSMLSRLISGGLLTWVLIFCALAGAAVLLLRATRPKGFHAPAPEAAEPEDGDSDPAEAAYRRRVARRTDAPPPVRESGDLIPAFLIAGLTAVLYVAGIAWIHYVPLSTLAAPAAAIPQQSLLLLIAPVLIIWFASYCIGAIRRMGGKPGAAVLLTAGLCLALTVIAHVHAGLFQAAGWLPLIQS